MNRWAAKIAAAGLCTGLLVPMGAGAQPLILKCSIGQEHSASVTVDVTNKTIIAGKQIVPAQMTAKTITWYDGGVLRMINRDTGAIFHRLPDGSHFQIGKCYPLER